jgi:ribonuclease HI
MERPTEGIVVDGSTRGNPGPSEYRGVDLATGEILFEVKIGVSSNNVTEFIALAHAIGYAVKSGHKTIYSDSQTALSWVRKKEVNSLLALSEKTKKSLDMKNKCLRFLKEQEIEFDGVDIKINEQLSVEKWYSSEWGEIPADYGRK